MMMMMMDDDDDDDGVCSRFTVHWVETFQNTGVLLGKAQARWLFTNVAKMTS